jgi:hypothetical protein
MTLQYIIPPFEVYTDLNGNPLETGYIYIGTTDLNPITNPISVFFDKDLTIPATQPIRTVSGYPSNNGKPAKIYTSRDYSILVQDKNNVLVYSSLSNIPASETNLPWYDALNYGDGTKTEETISAAISSLGSVNKYALLIKKGDWVINSTYTATDNIQFIFEQGVDFQISTGITFTINGPFPVMPMSKVFSLSGTGSVVFAYCEIIDPIIFGSDFTGVANSSAAFQAAIDSISGGTIKPLYGTYLLDTQVDLKSNITLDLNFSQINTALNGITLSATGTAGTNLENITVKNGKALATTPGSGSQQFFQSSYAHDILIENCEIIDYAGTGTKFNDATYNATVRNCVADNIGVISFYAEGDGPNSEPCYNLLFEGNQVSNFDYGIEVKESYNVQIVNNKLKTGAVGSTKYAILCTRNKTAGTEQAPYNIICEQNIVEDTDTGQYGIHLTQSGNISCRGNIVTNSGETAITVSGAVAVVSGNVVESPNLVGISVNYNSGVIGGTGGLDANIFAIASMTVSNNVVRYSANGNIPFNFSDLDSCTINNNIVTDSQYAGYGMSFDNCDDCDIHDNLVVGGATTYGYRIESDCSNLRWFNNRAKDMVTGITSFPSTIANIIEIADNGLGMYQEVAFVETSDATPTSIWNITLDTNTEYYIETTVIIRSGSYRAAYKVAAVIYRASGVATIQGTSTSLFSQENDAGLNADIVVSTNDAVVQVTGIAATTLNWKAQIKIMKSFL